jgi:integrase
LIGKLPLQDVGNKAVSEVVAKLSEQGYSAGSISLNIVIIKRIRKSAVNEDGEQLFPITWNGEMLDAPETGDQKRPTVTPQQVQDAISKAGTTQKALYAILAASGLRIGEALAIHIGSDDGVSTMLLPAESKIIVRQQLDLTGLGPTKTKAGQREVDLAPELITWLTQLFCDRFGELPVTLLFNASENFYRDALKDDGIIGGFHAFRRFRVTHLRMNGVPEPLVQYWTGHAAGNITEHYTQVAGEIESRKQHAAKVGLGFKLPEVV